jgi:hypothetical protein
MSEPEDSGGMGASPAIMGAVVILMAVGVGLILDSDDADDPTAEAPHAESTAMGRPGVRPPSTPAPTAAEFAPAFRSRPETPSALGLPFVEPHQTLTLETADIPSDEPLVIGLVVGVPHPDDDPLPVQIISLDGSARKTEAVPVGEEGSELRLEIPAGWLEPGQYLITVRVREKSALPGRRFVLDVR